MPERKLSSMCSWRWLSISADRSCSRLCFPNTSPSRENHALTRLMQNPPQFQSGPLFAWRQEARKNRGCLFPFAFFLAQLFPARACELVILRFSIVVRETPFRADVALLLEL